MNDKEKITGNHTDSEDWFLPNPKFQPGTADDLLIPRARGWRLRNQIQKVFAPEEPRCTERPTNNGGQITREDVRNVHRYSWRFGLGCLIIGVIGGLLLKDFEFFDFWVQLSCLGFGLWAGTAY